MENLATIDIGELKQDTLLDSLVILTHIHHKPFSAQSLTSGLPLIDGKLTPELFIRAAERAGFSSKLVKRDLHAISKMVLPAVLLLENQQACILTRAGQDGHAEVIFPDTGASHVEIEQAELARLYTGRALYFKPAYKFAESILAIGDGKHWFWAVVQKSKGIYGEVLVASLLVNLFALVSPLFIMNVYDRVVPNQAVETLWVLSTGVMIVLVFDLLMKALRGYFIDVAGKRADILLSSRTFSKVLDIQMKARPNSVGSFANNLQEFDGFREFFTSTTLVAIIDLPFVILFVLLIYSVGSVVAWVPLTAIPLIVGVGLVLQRPLQRLINDSFTESAQKHSMLVEALTGLDTIKGIRAEGVMQRKWEAFNARIAKLGLKSRFLSLSAVNIAQIVQQLASVLVVITGVYQIMAGEMSVGGLIACTILTGRCLAPMAQVATILTRYHHSIAAYRSIDSIMSLPQERPEGHKFLNRPKLDGNIEFKSVTFAYREQQIPAVSKVSFTVDRGEKIAIVGRMGSGKSTLQRLILNFYQPDEGAILIEGTDIQQIDPTDLRGNIGYVPQDIMLFSGNVRDNITIGTPEANDASVLWATKLCGLDEFINQHPQGFDLQVGERGINLSGGQRQAIAIARALLNDPAILVLDEPTNSMDNTTELNFKDRLKQILSEKTLILVTHKSSMLTLVDRLIVLNEGKVVADGPKSDVLKALSGG
jgi:ATP-binding cassette subfamily C protein LapB